MLNGIDKLKSIAETVGRERWTNYMSMSHSKRAAESTFPRAEWCDLRSYVETKELDKLRAALRVAIAQLEIYERAIDFSMADDMWVSNGEYDEWFKYKYTTWYQDVLLSAKQDAEKLAEKLNE